MPTDLAEFTADVASTFRSAFERAGLEFVVDCPALSQPIFVDREMWEKVVLNLLSNALKFTLDGIGPPVAPRARSDRSSCACAIRASGIPDDEMPHLFERFHRVQGTRGRTHEGSGIGLALVSELVRMHGGTLNVASRLHEGTTFTVSIPTGVAHLAGERVRESDAGARGRDQCAVVRHGGAALGPGQRNRVTQRRPRTSRWTRRPRPGASCSPTTMRTCGSTCSASCPIAGASTPTRTGERRSRPRGVRRRRWSSPT